MMPVSQKIRATVVELRTNDSRIYVRPSGWERLYLLWTFRNFNHLPKQVLNHRQQQVIEQLCRRAVVSFDGPIARTRIMGVIENMGILPDRESATLDLRGTMTLPDSSTGVHSEIERLRTRITKLVGSVLQRSLVRQSEPSEISAKSGGPTAQRIHFPNTLTWALAFAYAALLLPVLIYVGDRRASHKSVSPAALQVRSPASEPSPTVAPPDTERQMLSVGKVRQAAALVALEPRSSEASFRQHESTNSETPVLAQVPVTNLDPSAHERLQVAEAPERGFTYPVAPSPTLTGKVSLKVLIAADGTVTKVEVLSGNPALARAAARVVQRWQYRTYEVDGRQVEAETNFTISFVGDDAVSISFLAAPPTARPETSQAPE
jgi:TonB family protein